MNVCVYDSCFCLGQKSTRFLLRGRRHCVVDDASIDSLNARPHILYPAILQLDYPLPSSTILSLPTASPLVHHTMLLDIST